MSMATVQELREAGYIVKVRHNRFASGDYVEIKSPSVRELDPKGGSTEVRIEKDGRGVSGVAVCSRQDNYNRKIGRNIALGRALKALKVGV